MNEIFSQPVDKQALDLTHAIALQESGHNGTPNYNAVGDNGTSHGAYQWQPGNFEAAAKEAGLDPNDRSPENQDKVAYYQVKKYKDQGLDPGQIASIWNSGSPDNWKDHKGTTVINGKPIAYDTPAYVQGVQKQYQQILASSQAQGAGLPAAPVAPKPLLSAQQDLAASTPQEEQGAFRGTGAVGAVQDLSHGFAKGALQSGAGLASGLVKLGGGIESLLGMKQAQQQAHKGATGLDEFAGQQGLQSANSAEKAGKGLETAVEVGTPIGGLLGKGREVAQATPKIISQIAKDIAPKQTAKEAAEALERFGGKAGGLFRGAEINADPAVQKMAQVIAEHVPGFKPGGSFVENLNKTKEAVGRLATDLENKVTESGKNRIFPIKELASHLDQAIEKGDVSIGLKGTQFEKQAPALKEAALQIVKDKGGKVSDLLPARKEFDDLVERIYPNLYNHEYSPIRNAVASIRNAMTDFTEKHLPDDVGLKQSYKAQTNLIRAGENMAAKAVSGAEKEIGKTGIEKAAGILKSHPIISGLGGAALYGEAKKVPILGGLLP